MERLIGLLHERNKYLEKFHNINEKELVNLEKGQFENLRFFYDNREAIIKVLDKLDGMIGKTSHNCMKSIEFEEKDQTEVLKAVEYKDELITAILFQDLQVISFVEEAKVEIIRDLMGLEVAKEDIKSRLLGS